jgi:hypothetical protein
MFSLFYAVDIIAKKGKQMETPKLTIEQQLTLRLHRDKLIEITNNAIAAAGIEGRPVNSQDFMPQIELTLQVLEQAMRMENFAKEQVKHGWGL